MKIVISTDSTADIPAKYREEYGIRVLPLSIISGDSRESRSGIASNKADRHTLPANTVSTSPCCKARFLLTS